MIKIFSTKQFFNITTTTTKQFFNIITISKPFQINYYHQYFSTTTTTTIDKNKMKFNYPETRRDDSVFDIFKSTEKGSVKIYDPYRHLEDQQSPETKKWVDEENKITRSFLDQDNTSEKISNEIMKMLNFERFDWFRRRGSKLFFSRNPNTLNQNIIYLIDIDQITISKDGKSSAKGFENAIEFLNPNTYSKDGTWSLKSFVISKSGDHVCFSYSKAGSDWEEIAVKKIITTNELKTNKDDEEEKEDLKKKNCLHYAVVDLPDSINWCKFTSIKWDENETGFIYNRYPKPEKVSDGDKGTETDTNLNNKVYYHKLGDANESFDRVVFECPENPQWIFGTEFSHDHSSLFISAFRDCNVEHNLYVIRNFQEAIANKSAFKVEALIDNFDACYYYITNTKQGEYFFLTNLSAPFNRLISIQLNDDQPIIPNSKSKLEFKEIIQEKDYVLESVSRSSQEKFYVSYQKHVQDIIEVYDFNGKYLKDIKLPGPGSASLSATEYHDHIFINFSNLVSPSVTYYMDSKNDELLLFKEPHIEGFKSSDYECKQVFYESPKDKTKIPMFIAYKKTTDITSGNAPTYMTGYGGFNISYTQSFSIRNIYFLNKFNGIFVIANIRGGGEYGKAWHEAGSKKNKQNCFDDFIGAAEYLIKENYTNQNKLAVRGGSNGGLLMGAISNQRPDLFKCVVADVGVMDMLRFHLHTIGSNWVSDYGRSDNPDDFDVLIKYSPLNNVPKDSNQYPSIMLCTGDHDDRVIPAHSYKFISELQYQLGKKVDTPLLIRVDKDSGHGAGKGLSKQNNEIADIFNFFSKVLNVKLNF
ncbi:hypothetical protein ACTFIW_005129 [Dictyostelium discoideum]